MTAAPSYEVYIPQLSRYLSTFVQYSNRRNRAVDTNAIQTRLRWILWI